jgi:adenine-specific DNA-methyltransferase
MENRISLSQILLLENSVCVFAIDDTEMSVLSRLLDELFLQYDRNVVVVNHHPAGAGLEGTNISATHEYAIFMTPIRQKMLFGVRKDGKSSRIGFIRTGTAESNLRIGRPNSFYAVLIDPNTSKVVGVEPPPKAKDYPRERTEQGYIRIYPVSSDGTERVWRRSYESCCREIETDRIICVNKKHLYLLTDNADKYYPIFSNWTDKKYNAGAHGTNVLTNILGKPLFSYPKSIFNVMDCVGATTRKTKQSLVLDYFAGSGTTAHAVINLNREDGGKRKYGLVEMGQYFDTVLKPRIQKVIYSKDWKAGKPVSREGSSHMFKYMKLESYEDTLDNLIVKRTTEQNQALEMYPKVKEGYILHYWLDVETRNSDSLLNIDHFEDPFNYTMKIRQDNELKEQKIDLIETFNYLIGLYVQQTEIIRGFKVFRGKLRTGEKALVIWRNIKEKSNDDLNEFFVKQKYNTQDFEFDRVFVNGDNNLENLKLGEDVWKVILIEDEFKMRMFDVQEI